MPDFAEHRVHLETILQAALAAADPAEAVRRCWDPNDLAGVDRVFVVGAGKAGVAMGETIAELIGPRLAGGVIAVPQTPNVKPDVPRLTFITGGHPQPNAGSLQAGEAIADLLSTVAARDLVIALLSGGGSALMEQLNSGLTLAGLQSLTERLLRSGAPIQEINCVRKHLSQLKGGGLARLAAPARLLALILSDVIDDPLEVIASGPTAPDPTTVEAAQAILWKYNLGLDPQGLQETPKPGDPIFERVTNRLIGSNALARRAAARAAQALGFEARLPAVTARGEARELGSRLAREIIQSLFNNCSPTASARLETPGEFILSKAEGRALSIFQTGSQGGGPVALIYGGETTVTVQGNGVGGRNQELALAAAIVLDGIPHSIVIASFGTDGVDGPTPAAGAIATPLTCSRARVLGLNPAAMLANNDSYTFFNASGDCIVTGPTGTNVNDLVVVLIY